MDGAASHEGVLGAGAASGPSKATREARPGLAGSEGLGGAGSPSWGRACGWSCSLAGRAPENLLEASCPIYPSARAVGAFPLHQEPQNVKKPNGRGVLQARGALGRGEVGGQTSGTGDPWGLLKLPHGCGSRGGRARPVPLVTRPRGGRGHRRPAAPCVSPGVIRQRAHHHRGRGHERYRARSPLPQRAAGAGGAWVSTLGSATQACPLG